MEFKAERTKTVITEWSNHISSLPLRENSWSVRIRSLTASPVG